jgi:hypothetical protein
MTLDFDAMRYRMMGLGPKDRKALLDAQSGIKVANIQAGATTGSATTRALADILGQKLKNVGGIKVADIGASAERYRADQSRIGQLGAAQAHAGAMRYAADRGYAGEEMYANKMAELQGQRTSDLRGIFDEYSASQEVDRLAQSLQQGEAAIPSPARPPEEEMLRRRLPRLGGDYDLDILSGENEGTNTLGNWFRNLRRRNNPSWMYE